VAKKVVKLVSAISSIGGAYCRCEVVVGPPNCAAVYQQSCD
jgi:hypothetical protein